MSTSAIDINESEIIVFILMLFILIYYWINRTRIAQSTPVRILDHALNFLFISKVCTIVEGLFWGDFFNILEHFAILFATISFGIWLVDLKKEQIKKSEALKHA